MRPGGMRVLIRRGISVTPVAVLREKPHHLHAHKHKQDDSQNLDAEGRDSGRFFPTENLQRKRHREECDPGHHVSNAWTDATVD